MQLMKVFALIQINAGSDPAIVANFFSTIMVMTVLLKSLSFSFLIDVPYGNIIISSEIRRALSNSVWRATRRRRMFLLSHQAHVCCWQCCFHSPFPAEVISALIYYFFQCCCFFKVISSLEFQSSIYMQEMLCLCTDILFF